MKSVIGIFAGVGGFERGLQAVGYRAALLCEVDPAARAVLKRQFPGVSVAADVMKLRGIPKADVLTAGFPCQDLSQAGLAKGIDGESSSLVAELFRLLRPVKSRPRWIVLENVPFMLQLQRGRAMRRITAALEERGYAWAYRIVDARSFGLPQRRRRVIIVASNEEDPKSVLLENGHTPAIARRSPNAFGFYWTEGNTGLGWAPDCVPALKAGSSSVSIPCPPAIWLVHKRSIVTPDVRDAERLQGFPYFWSNDSERDPHEQRCRWRLIGNAVPPPIAEWIGERIHSDSKAQIVGMKVSNGSPWGVAGWGHRGKRFTASISEWPVNRKMTPLTTFLKFPTKPLSARATKGFLQRLVTSSLKKNEEFLADLRRHRLRMELKKG
jgi:DNA (cytosine-5)-methyltransferase 1